MGWVGIGIGFGGLGVELGLAEVGRNWVVGLGNRLVWEWEWDWDWVGGRYTEI